MNAFKTASKWLFIICLPVLLLTLSIAVAVNSAWLYQYSFSQFHISETTGIARTELDKAAAGLIRYFNSSEERIELVIIKDGKPFQLFNEKEITHLKDVKDRIWLDYKVLLGTLILVLGFVIGMVSRRDRRQLARAAVGGSALTLALMAALGIAVLTGFDRLFIYFHLILRFPNDFWQLDPTRDYLVMLVPQEFWFNLFLFVAMFIAGLAVIILGLGIFYLVRNQGTEL